MASLPSLFLGLSQFNLSEIIWTMKIRLVLYRTVGLKTFLLRYPKQTVQPEADRTLRTRRCITFRRLDVSESCKVEAIDPALLRTVTSNCSGPCGSDIGPRIAIQRIFDVAGSLLLLILFATPAALVTLFIKLDSPGPVVFRQDRVGRHGQVFSLLKFRSMHVDAEAEGPCWATERDPRVTRFGRLIRTWRIDEFPQLVNVLRGEMSLVGPRPERPCFVDLLEQVIPRYQERHSVLPGITGWAQVNYKYGDSIEDARIKLRYDLQYVYERNIRLDLRILVATVPVILFRIGAR